MCWPMPILGSCACPKVLLIESVEEALAEAGVSAQGARDFRQKCLIYPVSFLRKMLDCWTRAEEQGLPYASLSPHALGRHMTAPVTGGFLHYLGPD